MTKLFNVHKSKCFKRKKDYNKLMTFKITFFCILFTLISSIIVHIQSEIRGTEMHCFGGQQLVLIPFTTYNSLLLSNKTLMTCVIPWIRKFSRLRYFRDCPETRKFISRHLFNNEILSQQIITVLWVTRVQITTSCAALWWWPALHGQNGLPDPKGSISSIIPSRASVHPTSFNVMGLWYRLGKYAYFPCQDDRARELSVERVGRRPALVLRGCLHVKKFSRAFRFAKLFYANIFHAKYI